MASIFSWIKKEIGYIIGSFFQIVKALFLVILLSSGLVCAIFLRYLGFNGTIISFVSVLVELISLLLCYFILRGHLKTEEKAEGSIDKSQKFK